MGSPGAQSRIVIAWSTPATCEILQRVKRLTPSSPYVGPGTDSTSIVTQNLTISRSKANMTTTMHLFLFQHLRREFISSFSPRNPLIISRRSQLTPLRSFAIVPILFTLLSFDHDAKDSHIPACDVGCSVLTCCWMLGKYAASAPL